LPKFFVHIHTSPFNLEDSHISWILNLSTRNIKKPLKVKGARGHQGASLDFCIFAQGKLREEFRAGYSNFLAKNVVARDSGLGDNVAN
jgi:hypothetical protein